MLKFVLCSAICMLSIVSDVWAQQGNDPDRISPTAKYQQSDAVRARFSDVPISLVAPSFAKATPSLTTHDEAMSFLRDKVATSSRASVLSLGKSAQGRDIPLVLFSSSGVKTLEDADRQRQPVVLFIGQQHGNEPAGGEAMLALAHSLAHGPLGSVLEHMMVAIVPRANPDGAAVDLRGAANGADLNRDHLMLAQAETRAIHAAMRSLKPLVVFDHHEFSVANRWLEKFGGVLRPDVMLLAATHPLVSEKLRDMARDDFQKPVELALGKHGLTSFVYSTTSYSRADKLVSTGGAAPGIARNAFGLGGAVSYLVETRGVGVGMEGWQRRVASHYVVAEAVLTSLAQQGGRVLRFMGLPSTRTVDPFSPAVVAAQVKDHPVNLPLVDPVTGQDKTVAVTLRDSREWTAAVTREVPNGYLVTANLNTIAGLLDGKGLIYCRLDADVQVKVEAFAMAGTVKPADVNAINPDQSVQVSVSARTRSFPKGTLYVPIMHAARLGMAMFEADSPGGLVPLGALPPESGEAPVYRVVDAPAPPMRFFNQHRECGTFMLR